MHSRQCAHGLAVALYNLNYRFKKLRWATKASSTPLAELYQQHPVSFRKPVAQQRFMVVDCEMSGLDPNQHQLLSIGWVIIEHNRINYASGKHLLMHADRGAGDSTLIHGLSDSHIAGAASTAKVLSLLSHQINDSILVFHHAGIDVAFLQKAALETFQCPLLFPYVDTMEIEKRRLRLQGKTASLRLGLCRDRYNLPVTQAHNALSDAIATAELFLAQSRYLEHKSGLKVSELGVRV